MGRKGGEAAKCVSHEGLSCSQCSSCVELAASVSTISEKSSTHFPRTGQCATRFFARMPDGQIVWQSKDFRRFETPARAKFVAQMRFSLTPMLANLQSALASDENGIAPPHSCSDGFEVCRKVSGLSFQLSNFKLERGKVCHERQRTQVVQDMHSVLTDRSAHRAWHTM